MVEKDRVSAFAVSGFAGAINPDHEMTVKRIIREETGLFVTCGMNCPPFSISRSGRPRPC
jgi:N-methylhydantoinase A/oxoprolinase/acetone carboxylase beta subunit